MLTQLYTLPAWIRHTALGLLLASLLLMGGCSDEQVSDVTTGTAAGLIASTIMCLAFHACHF